MYYYSESDSEEQDTDFEENVITSNDVNGDSMLKHIPFCLADF